MYVEELIGPDTVDTVPPATFEAFRDHGRVHVRAGAFALAFANVRFPPRRRSVAPNRPHFGPPIRARVWHRGTVTNELVEPRFDANQIEEVDVLNPRNSIRFAVSAAAAITMIGCGSTSSRPSTTQTVTASTGATLTAGVATLTVPPGALTRDTTVTLREAEPQHASRAARVEVEPHDALAAGHEAHLSVKVSDTNPRVKMHQGADDSLEDVELADRNHHSFKTNMATLGDVEVEVEHGDACTPACTANQECDDGMCKAHDDAARTCDTVCTTGEECDDGTCKTHNAVEIEHGGAAGTCSPKCLAPSVCHDGLCSAHG
jgi:hypothetical protein